MKKCDADDNPNANADANGIKTKNNLICPLPFGGGAKLLSAEIFTKHAKHLNSLIEVILMSFTMYVCGAGEIYQ